MSDIKLESTKTESPREQLLKVMKREQMRFRKQVIANGPDKCEDGQLFEYITREYIVAAIREGCGDAEVLLRKENPLAAIYRDCKYYFDDYTSKYCYIKYSSSDFKPTIREAITDRENNILRLEFLRSKGWPAVDD